MEKNALLFYASGAAFEAEQAGGQAKQTFLKDVTICPDGPFGPYFRCEDTQLLAWKAPGNLYAQRGTLSFFWRSRYPVGPTPFPIFRVGYADHSSWDCVFLRVDWSGKGFEAFVTDLNLSRTRAVYETAAPAPETWIHFAVGWDELWGVKFYVDGKLAAQEYRPGVYSAGLDQFGPHSRIIASWQVQSDYNFIRGGDVCRIAVHDQMLPPQAVEALARGELPQVPAYQDGEGWQENWNLRNGLLPQVPPLPDRASVRKVEIHDAYDLKRWWWKGLDGIRETTWPGVFNRSRLKGRNDYFQLPDWDCYSISGKAITFHAPDEPYNHVEISGSAFGKLELVTEKDVPLKTLLTRPAGMERTADAIEPQKGGLLRFTNELIEEPIGDFSLYQVGAGTAPQGAMREVYRPTMNEAGCPAQQELEAFIRGRYPQYERNILTATSGAADETPIRLQGRPFVNLILPYEADPGLGLDGIEIAFGRAAQRTAVAVQIKDPLWYYRNLAHFVFTCEQGAQKTVWFDTRDRILPQCKCLYVTLAAESIPALEALLSGMTLTAVYKPAGQAKAEHTLDRFTQVRDLYGHLTEEHPSVPELNMFNRIYADVSDLMKVAPGHKPGQYYYYDVVAAPGRGRGPLNPDYKPDYEPPKAPEGVPEWAFEQIENLKFYKRLINWYIDHRQIENGELGGGLSDDGDFVATWGWLPMMGSDREKILRGMAKNLQAFYDEGLFTNGMCSIQADELHSSEEGLVTLAAQLMADTGSPKWLERAMENARSLDWITGINPSGYRYVRSSYFNGSMYAKEAPWNCTRPAVYSMMAPSWLLLRHNHNPQLKKTLLEMADGVRAKFNPQTGDMHAVVRYEDDHDFGPTTREGGLRSLLHAASHITGDPAYENMLPENQDRPRTRASQLGKTPENFMPIGPDGVVDKAKVAALYRRLNFLSGIHEYYNTLGSCWIDRVQFDHSVVATHRVGDKTGLTARALFPMGRFGWRFDGADDEKIAILAPESACDRVRILAANISDTPVLAKLVAEDLYTGLWAVQTGLDTDGDDKADAQVTRYERTLEDTQMIDVRLEPHATTVIELTLLEKAPASSHERCDLGIGPEDVKIFAHGMNVTVHSLGCLPTPEADVVLLSPQGKELGRQTLPPLPAPTDFWPKYRDVIFNLYNIPSLKGCRIVVDPENKLNEITRVNNEVVL